MLKIDVQYQGAVVATHEVKTERVTIGRNPDNDIRIDNLAVSGRHAEIRKVLNAYLIEDLKSTNGTFVNEKKIDKYELLDGDQVIIGKHTLLIRYKTAGKGAAGFDQTMVLDTQQQKDLLKKNR